VLHLKGDDFSGIDIIKSEAAAVIFYSLAVLIVNLSLLSIAWFSLKEKEA
jgi:hypothetical protein